METLELFYPQISARAGPYTFDKGVEIEVYSSKASYFDWAKIRFTEQFQPKISLKKKDPAAIELGCSLRRHRSTTRSWTRRPRR